MDIRWKKIFRKMRFNILIAVLFGVVAVASIWLLRVRLLQNAQETGTSLARNYSSEEENNVTVYTTLMKLGTEYIDGKMQTGASTEEIQTWISDFFEYITSILGTTAIDPYAVIDGSIVAANPWDGDSEYDAMGTEWYQKAMQADGEVVFTDAYIDAVYGKPVLTIAQKLKGSADVLAFDIFPENFHVQDNPLELPEGGSYYLFDRAGTLLFYEGTVRDFSDQDVREYMQGILDKIDSGSMDAFDSSIEDLDGNMRTVYYYEMSNGWLSVVTMSISSVLAGLNRVTAIFTVIFLLILLIIVFMAWKDFRLSSAVERASETVRVLGNSYYAIYRIDYIQGTYEIIKPSEFVRKRRMQKKGKYEELLNALKAVTEKNTYQEFRESFSLESVRRLVHTHTRNFGGDFLRRFGDELRWVNVELLFDEMLEPGEAVLCFREVNEEKQQQMRQLHLLESSLEAARRSEKAKMSFFNNMSHDMRTPLNGIIGFTGLMKECLEDREKICGYIDKIELSSRQLLGLINDVLEMSRLEQGKVSLDYREFDLEKSTREITDLFRDQAVREKKDFTVVYDIRNKVVLGDFFRISQILNNLLSNAFKYSGEGAGIQLQIHQCEYQEHTKYQFVVSDTGYGMSREFLDRIFDPYARETRFGVQQTTGTGLGMPIVKNLVSQMSGEITVESEPGKGSTFIVTIPLRTVGKVVTEDAAEEKGEAVDISGIRVLLAEDNEMNMEIAREILSMYEVETVPAWNGQEAVDIFKKEPPFSFDAILMDMQMPQMDGCQAARMIRSLSRPDARTIPIIAVTANAFAEDIAKTTEAGMNAHISKPIDFEVLSRTLYRYVKKE